jgi:hypothetical protein
MLGFIRGLGVKQKEAEQKQKDLRAILLERDVESRPSEEARKAIAYCTSCIHSYEDWFEWNEARWLRWQRVVIIGGVTATLAGIITVPGVWIDSYPFLGSLGWIRGVPAAIVTIAAGYLSSFTYREDAVRHELTANALWSELARYQGQADPYNKSEKEDTSAFVNAVCRIVETELHSWSTLVVGRGAADDTKKDDTDKDDTDKDDTDKDKTQPPPPAGPEVPLTPPPEAPQRPPGEALQTPRAGDSA